MVKRIIIFILSFFLTLPHIQIVIRAGDEDHGESEFSDTIIEEEEKTVDEQYEAAPEDNLKDNVEDLNNSIIKSERELNVTEELLDDIQYSNLPDESTLINEVSGTESSNWKWPTYIHKLNDPFDYPNYPKSGNVHHGTDFGVPLNSNVYATCDGEIVGVYDKYHYNTLSAGTKTLGVWVVQKATVNKQTVYIFYGHLNSFKCEKGDKVKAGDVIALSGNNGYSTDPHLHYEVSTGISNTGEGWGGTRQNPKNYLPGTTYTFTTIDGSTVSPVYNLTNTKTISDGIYSIRCYVNQTFTFNIQYRSNENRGNVALGYYGADNYHEKWEFIYQDNGYYTIRNLGSDALLDVAGSAGEADKGNNVQQWHSTTPSVNQRWQVIPEGDYYYLVPEGAKWCAADITNASYTDGSNIQIWTQNSSNAQKFALIPESLVALGNTKNIPEGQYSILPYGNKSFGLSIADNSTESKGNVHLWTLTYGNQFMIFNIKYLDGGYYGIQNVGSSGYLDVTSGGGSDTNVQQWVTETPTKNMRWQFVDDGSGNYYIVPGCYINTTLDVKGGTYANGTNVQVWRQRTNAIQKFYLQPRGDINNMSVAIAGTSYTYTGNAITPAITVKDFTGKTLTNGTDYTVSYTNNVNIGTATAVVSGINYFSGTKRINYTIAGNPANDLSKATIELEKYQYIYVGTEIKPAVTVKLNGAVIDPSNYTVSYTSNNGKGTGVVTVTGKGNYYGNVKGYFEIIDTITLTAYENISGKNYCIGSDFETERTGLYYSRDTSVATVSVDPTQKHNGFNSLKVVNSTGGSSGKDLAFITSTNWGYTWNSNVPDVKEMTFSFWAKSSANGTKMYFRYGYESSYKSVELTTEWKKYVLRMDRNLLSNNWMHPYVDRAGTVWLSELQLEDGTEATEFVPENGRQSSMTQQYGSMYALPEAPEREGYIFMGWYTANAGGKQITASNPVELGNISVYAHWIKDLTKTADIYGSSLALEGKIGINFYLDIKEKDVNELTVVMSMNGTETRVPAAEGTIRTVSGRQLRMYEYPVTAKQMRDKVLLTVEDMEGRKIKLTKDGEEYTEGYSYSAAEYFARAEETGTDRTKKLARVLNNYGKYTQIYFNYNVTDEVKSVTDVSEVTLDTFAPYKAVMSSDGITGLSYMGGSAMLDDAIGYRLYFNVENSHQISEYTFTIDNEEVVPILRSGTQYYIEKADIAAKDLGKMNTVIISGNDEIMIVRYSALSYGYTALGLTEEKRIPLQNMCRAMYLYNQQAIEYFNTK